MLDYVKQQVKQGVNSDQIKASLSSGGWQMQDIEEALRTVTAPMSMSITPPPPAPMVTSMPAVPAASAFVPPKTFVSPSPVSPSPTSFVPPQSVITSMPDLPPLVSKQTQVAPSSHHGLLKFLLIILFLALLGAGGVFGYPYYQDYVNPPEKILGQALENMSHIKSDSISGLVTVEMSDSDIPGFASSTRQLPFKKLVFSFNGSSDISDPQNLRGKMSLGFDTGLIPKVNAELIYNGPEKYIKVDDIPNLGFFDPSFLNGVWIKLDLADLQKKFNVKTIASSTVSELSPEKIADIKQLALESHMFVISQKLPEEVLDGVNTYHYGFILDKNKMIDFVASVSKIIGSNPITDEELAKEKKAFDQVVFSPGEIWIGKDDIYMHKISFGMSVTPPGSGVPQITNTFVMSFKDFNQPVEVIAPDSFKTIDEVGQMVVESLKKQSALKK